MSVKKKGLGRNFGSLISTKAEVEKVQTQPMADIPDGTLKYLPIEWLSRGRYQPRRDMSPDALEELAESIKVQGVMQPVVVRKLAEQSYELIAGERRWRACQIAQLDKIPAVIRNVSDENAMAMALIENIQRENLNPVDEALALQRLQAEFKLTQAEVAQAVGKSRASVANLLRLIGLETEVRRMLEHGDIDQGHGKVLLGLTGEQQVSAARHVSSQGLSVRQTEAHVRRCIEDQVQPSSQQKEPDVNVVKLEQMLASRLGASVKIKHGAKGKGSLVIKYSSLDELDGILKHVN